MKIIKPKSQTLIHLSVWLILIIITVVIFLFMEKSKIELENTLQKTKAQCAKAEKELCELEEKYNQLENKYLELERLKASQKNSPVVYLTFDDGPSENTIKILDILDRYSVKATFFVIGDSSLQAASIYRRIVDDGHAVGNHTYSHNYSEIYSSTEEFWKDIQKNDDLFFKNTGKHLDILRFPGGSNNTVSEKYCKNIMNTLVNQAVQKNITYFDWNVSSLDAEAIVQKKEVIINAVIDGCKGKKCSIVLLHDNKKKTTTVEALPKIIESLKNDGFVFKTLSTSTPSIQFLK